MNTITIKLKPYLQEFLQCSMDSKIPKASSNNILGVLARPYIEYVPKDFEVVIYKSDDYFTFEVPDKINDKRIEGNVYIKPCNHKYIEHGLHLYFRDVFFNFMDDKVRYIKRGKRGQIKKALIQFCFDYKITFDNINYETLKKSYYRERKRKQKKENMSSNSPLIFTF